MKNNNLSSTFTVLPRNISPNKEKFNVLNKYKRTEEKTKYIGIGVIRHNPQYQYQLILTIIKLIWMKIIIILIQISNYLINLINKMLTNLLIIWI